MPVKVEVLISMLKETNYDETEVEYLKKGFLEGFDIGYKGPQTRQSKARNIPLRIGNEVKLWNKLMKELKAQRVAGLYDNIPYDNYIQSPIGLVPKSGNTEKTRLIFHLSYDFNKKESDVENDVVAIEANKSLNFYTPREICTVKYQDLDHAVEQCLEAKHEQAMVLGQTTQKAGKVLFEEEIEPNQPIFMSKSDVQSAFRLVPLSRWCWRWLIMMAKNPKTKTWQYFIDKCLPFGASISCAIFQHFSNALCHLAKARSGRKTITNYLDDFLFIAYAKSVCNMMVTRFLDICSQIEVPVAEDKTEWVCSLMVFLGILLNSQTMTPGIPEEKRKRAIHLLSCLIDKKKATVNEIQKLCGYLNFLNRAIHPGKVFMRRMYAKYSYLTDKSEKGKAVLKPYHHVRLDSEFKSDCLIWLRFLDNNSQLSKIVQRPMIDLNMFHSSKDIGFFTDASAAEIFGYGCVYGNN